MAAAAEVQRHGRCRPCRRVHRMVVIRRRQQDSGIHDGSVFFCRYNITLIYIYLILRNFDSFCSTSIDI